MHNFEYATRKDKTKKLKRIWVVFPDKFLLVKVGGGGVESEFSDRFGYSLALAKPNNIMNHPVRTKLRDFMICMYSVLTNGTKQIL